VVPSMLNGLSKRSIADCLQTRPIDYRDRLISIRGTVEPEILMQINQALKVVFDLL
jgi:mRNA interferase MazF